MAKIYLSDCPGVIDVRPNVPEHSFIGEPFKYATTTNVASYNSMEEYRIFYGNKCKQTTNETKEKKLWLW